jgi:tRNA(Ile)-lysidine synthase
MASPLINYLRDFCAKYSDKPVCVAFSGGLDSTVLLHALSSLCSSVRAMHVNHGLSPNAGEWAVHAQAFCEALDVGFQSFDINLNSIKGKSLEAQARELRYNKLKEKLGSGELLLTAHHRNDQAETLLLQLLRGAGVKGLSAMPAFKPFGPGFHARPLLNIDREELLAYANAHDLRWIEDESNQEIHFNRNYLRKNIIPLLQERWPGAVAMLARSASHCASTQTVIHEAALEDCARAKGKATGTLSVRVLLALGSDRQRHVLRHWFESNSVRMPSSIKLQHIITDALQANIDALPCVEWGGHCVRRYRDDLYLLDIAFPHDKSQVFSWNLNEMLELPHVMLEAKKATGHGMHLGIDQVEVRFRQGGEQITLTGRHTHDLKTLFQEWGVPPWERDSIPLLFVENQLAAVVGYVVAAPFEVSKEQMGRLTYVV